ncbi:hypothetical protein LTR33_017143, partial [Friedmanniomyces endolithicus]
PDGRKAGSNPVQLATFTAKLGSLQQGYRHLPLYNPQGEKYKEAKLFVRITKEAPVPAFEDEAGDVHSMLSAAAAGVVSPRLGEAGRPDRSWPRRIFSRNPSERRRGGEGPDSRGLLSRTSSMDRESIRS